MNDQVKSKIIKYFFFTLFITTLITGCSLSENKTGYHINKKIREDIWKLSSDFCTSIMKNDYKYARNMLGDSLLTRFDTVELNRRFFALQWALMESRYYTQNSYYQKNLLDEYWVRARFDDPEIKPFSLKYGPLTKETAITTAILEKGDSKSCLTTIFGRYSEQWKIDYVYNGWLELKGKDAFEWLDEAKNWIKKEDYVMATYCIQICYWLLNPAYDIWTYRNESEILDITQNLNRQIGRELHHTVIENIKTKPKILEFYPIMNLDVIFPGITYYTNISLSDTIAIQEECSLLDTIFADYYKNVDSELIYVKIVDNDDPWTDSKKSIIMTRNLIKFD